MDKYWTSVVKGIAEFQQIAVAENPEVDELKGCLTRLLNDGFIKDATEYGVKRWESILNIIPNPDDTLDDRKVKILSLLNMTLPYTYKMLDGVVESILGEGNYNMYLRDYTLTLDADFKSDNEYRDVLNLFENVVPKNLIIDIQEKVIPVDYVEFDGTFYFDTGMVGNQDTAYEIEYAASERGGMYSFGLYESGVRIYSQTNGAWIESQFGGGPYVRQYVSIATDGVRFNVYNSKQSRKVYNCNTGEEYVDNTEYSNTDFTTTSNLLIGTVNRYQKPELPITGRIYRCKVWQGGVLVRDFIPVITREETRLYDLVNKKYYRRVKR